MKVLMQPRYKVIADYPDCFSQVGNVLCLEYNERQKHYEYKYAEHDGMYSHSESWFNEYPHLFKKLEWWEEREQDEMPEYVKRSGRIFKIESSAKLANSKIPVQYLADRDHNGVKNYIWLHSTLPATEQEYNDFLNSKTNNHE